MMMGTDMLPENPNPTDSDIGGWVLHCMALDSYTHRAGALTAARENLGLKGMAVMLQKMKLETALDVVEWLRGNK
jgi:hypothetical protein